MADIQFRRALRHAVDVHAAIDRALFRPGDHLRCARCGAVRKLYRGDIARYIVHGWPQCCDGTMRWLSRRGRIR